METRRPKRIGLVRHIGTRKHAGATELNGGDGAVAALPQASLRYVSPDPHRVDERSISRHKETVIKNERGIKMAKGALRVLQSKRSRKGLVELCEYPTGLFRSNKRYGVQVNDKEVDIRFLTATTDDLREAKRVFDSY